MLPCSVAARFLRFEVPPLQDPACKVFSMAT